MKLTIYTDGGARGNPGPAAIGIVVLDGTGKVIFKQGEYIGETTNNQAEYKALILALEKVQSLGATEVQCYLDSELVVRQITGLYKVREEGLKDLAMQVIRLVKNFQKINFSHVPREKNKIADKLLNEALDKETDKENSK